MSSIAKMPKIKMILSRAQARLSAGLRLNYLWEY